MRVLCAQGLCLVAQNVRCRVGEIDLIMWDGPVLVFVEVRYRRRSGYGGAANSVNHAKQLRIRRASLWWLQQHHANSLPACRFDVYTLDGGEATWIKNAFSA
jgi:putative endonuclease